MNRKGASSRRSWHLIVGLALVTAWAVCPLDAHAEGPAGYELADLKALERSFVDLAEKVQPSVVAIRCYQVRDAGKPGRGQVKLPISQGSGFVIESDGYIATNQHVIEDADVVSVVLHNGLQYGATLRQMDVRSDLAVLKIDATGLKPVRFSDLGDVRVNQWTFACGNPFGLAYENNGRASVTYGVVSALDRQMTRRLSGNGLVHYYGNLIETSSTINPGGSGGPLFNLDGEVIGVVTAIETSSGVSEGHGFAIPIDKNTRRILDTLKSGQVVRYGFLGVTVNDVEPPRSKRVAHSRGPRGARIDRISPSDGPAAKAGLRADDIVIAFDGVPVENSDHLVRLVQYTPVGREVEITYLRRNVKRKTAVTIGDRDELLGLARQAE